MVGYIIFLLGSGPLAPVEFGLSSGDGFVFSTLMDDDLDGRIELFAPFDSTMAIRTDLGGAGDDDGVIWSLTGAEVREREKPYDVPLFFDTAGGALGIDLGTLLPPPASFSPGEVLTVADGQLAEWSEPRFIDTTGVAGLPDFVALHETLPNFTGNVTVSDLHIRVEGVVPEPATFVLVVMLLLFGFVGSFRSRNKWEGIT